MSQCGVGMPKSGAKIPKCGVGMPKRGANMPKCGIETPKRDCRSSRAIRTPYPYVAARWSSISATISSSYVQNPK